MGEVSYIPLLAVTNAWWVALVLIVMVLFVVLTMVAYLILFERWMAAAIQDRVGPNRAGPAGLLQPLADVFKLLIKEDFTPRMVDRRLYVLAPAMVIIPALTAMAVVPFGGLVVLGGTPVNLQIAQVDVAVLFLLAMSSLGVYGLVVGGWASDSKFSLLGGLRSAAQLVSYEIPLGLAVISIVLLAGTLRLEQIIAAQSGTWWGWLPRWNIFTQPVAFFVFFVCALAETNRLPFDLPEAEQELVGGFHTEYSSMKFGLFFLAEFTHLTIMSAVATVLFLGGWGAWGLLGEQAGRQTEWHFGLARAGVMLLKMGLVVAAVMHIRWTLPRFRFDQLARLAWEGLVPAALLLVFANGLLLWLAAPPWAFLLGNAAVAAVVAFVVAVAGGPLTGRQRTLREADAGP